MRKILIALLASTLTTAGGAYGAPTGSISGRVLPVAGRPAPTHVWAAPPDGSVAPVAAAIAADGSFAIAAVPAGSVSLAVETSEGLYAVPSPITIAPGATRRVQLALGGRQDTSPAQPAEEPKKKKKPAGVWANPVYATLIVVGSALVVGLLISQLTEPNNKPASPSTSSQ